LIPAFLKALNKPGHSFVA